MACRWSCTQRRVPSTRCLPGPPNRSLPVGDRDGLTAALRSSGGGGPSPEPADWVRRNFDRERIWGEIERLLGSLIVTVVTTVPLIEVECAICGSSDSEPLLEAGDNEHYLVGSFIVARCANGAATRSPIRGPHWSRFPICTPNRTRRSRRRTDRAGWPAKSWYAYVTQFGQRPRRRTGRMLEVGCGAGANLRRHRDLGLDVVGIEPSAGAAACASADGLDVIVGTDENVADLDREAFDVVHALMVVEHVPDPRRTLQRLFDVTAPGGVVAISTPNFDCRSRRRFGRHWFPLQLPRHFHHFDADRLCSLLDDTGWVVDRVWYQPTLTDTGKSLRLAAADRGVPLPGRAVKLGFNLLDLLAFPLIVAVTRTRVPPG